MAKIAYVKAWGLWSHFETVFEFSPGLTVVTGPNGSGKSTLIRIIKWVAQGEPSGESFIFKVENDAGETVKQADEGKAEIGLDNGVVITKTRRKGKTTYTINTVAEPFEKAEVPQEVKEALGIDKYSFGDFESYLNYAFQLEAPFLLSESPSVGAKVLGKLAGTEAVDLAIREVAKRTHKTREEKRLADKEVERINGDLLDYQDLDDLKQQLTACEYLVEQLDQAVARKTDLAAMDNTFRLAVDKYGELAEQLQHYMVLSELEADMENVEAAQLRYGMLLDLYGQVDSAVNTIADLGQQLSEYREVESAGLLLTETEKRAARLTNLKDLSTELLTYTQRIDAAREYLDTVKDLDVAASNMQYVERTTEKLEALKTLRGAYTTADTERKRLTEDLEALKGTQEAAELFRVVDDKLVRLNSLKALSDEVQSKTGLAESYKDDVRKAGEAYLAAENELAAAWEAAGGTCPLCNQPVSSDHAH